MSGEDAPPSYGEATAGYPAYFPQTADPSQNNCGFQADQKSDGIFPVQQQQPSGQQRQPIQEVSTLNSHTQFPGYSSTGVVVQPNMQQYVLTPDQIRSFRPETRIMIRPPPHDFMWLACCVFWFVNPPCGLVAFLFSLNSASDYKDGNYDGALKNGSISRSLSRFGCGITTLTIMICIIVNYAI